mgnify:CR=1 FL=1
MAIDRGASTPLYVQLKDALVSEIGAGDLKPGDRVGSESELERQHGVSRITVRQALKALVQEGALYRVPGKGTFVRKRSRHVERVTRLTGFGENVSALGLEPGYRTLRAEPLRVSKEIADRLRAQSGKAFAIERVLLADGEPIAVQRSYVPLWIVKAAPPNAFSIAALDRGSLYRAIALAGAHMARADEVVEPGLATREEAELLETHEGALVLRVARTVVDADGVPLEYVLMIYRADAYTYRTTLYPGSD